MTSSYYFINTSVKAFSSEVSIHIPPLSSGGIG